MRLLDDVVPGDVVSIRVDHRSRYEYLSEQFRAGQAGDDRARFALEASLRRAREGVEAVLRKSTAKRAKSESALRDAKEAAAAAEDDARREVARFDALAAALPCHSTS